jgi:hypothetical protein
MGSQLPSHYLPPPWPPSFFCRDAYASLLLLLLLSLRLLLGLLLLLQFVWPLLLYEALLLLE